MKASFLDELADAVQVFRSAANSHDAESFDTAESEFDQMMARAGDHGVTRINEGGGRVVFRGGSIAGDDNVIKIEKRGADENRDAVNTWTAMDEDARNYVAPLMAWSGDHRWIIQRRAGAGTPGSTGDLLESLADAGWTLADNTLENLGTLNGRPVVVDLGRLYRV